MLRVFVILLLVLLGGLRDSAGEAAAGPVDEVRTLLLQPEQSLDLVAVKLAVDRLIDPSIDERAARGEVDRLASEAAALMSSASEDRVPTGRDRLRALRTVLYRPGPWNGGRAFEYDFSNPLGQGPKGQLLSRYVATRKGNCVSMPALVLAVGTRLGLDMTLSTAPLHVFVKWREAETGQTWNLEATSGAGFTRDVWYRAKLPMTDAAVASGAYLKTLSRREAASVIANSLIEHLISVGRYEEAIGVADSVIEAWPSNVHALVKRGTALHHILQRDIAARYPRASDIPPSERSRAMALYRANQADFARAEALGWREPTLDPSPNPSKETAP